jgi:hypothetical protein
MLGDYDKKSTIKGWASHINLLIYDEIVEQIVRKIESQYFDM